MNGSKCLLPTVQFVFIDQLTDLNGRCIATHGLFPNYHLLLEDLVARRLDIFPIYLYLTLSFHMGQAGLEFLQKLDYADS